MSPATMQVLIAVLAVLLGAVSALAGALWMRCRTAPLVRVAQLARELADRQRALEALITRLETRPSRPGRFSAPVVVEPEPAAAHPPGATRRLDPHPAEGPLKGPTLITVPDLAAPPPEPTPASLELVQRFGAIWKLADEGASPDVIARITGQAVGQVELILALRRHFVPSEARA